MISRLNILLSSIYFIIILLFFIISFIPSGRVWGINIWGYWPLGYKLIAVLTGCIAWYIGYRAIRTDAEFQINLKQFHLFSILGFVVYGAITFLLQVNTYFLGDGYAIISSLATANPLAQKNRQLIETLAHINLFEMLGGNGESDALLASQIISYAGFLFYCIGIYLLSQILWKNEYAKRFLFVLGMLSCGNLLLYYGYVENYSLFNAVLLLYISFAVYTLKAKKFKWLIIPFQAVLLLFHIFGVFFIPATFYLLFTGTKAESWYSRLTKPHKIVLIGLIILLPFAAILYLYITDFFVRLSLVPFFTSVFVQDGYTQFSPAHIWDYIQLLFILIPGLVILLPVLWRIRNKIEYTPVRIFLLFCLVFSLIGAFVFDPKLGMPRDWDLFAFLTVPLAVFLFYSVIDKLTGRTVVFTLVLVVSLGVVTTASRAYNEFEDSIAIQRFKYYLSLDRVKNRNSWLLLYNYYNDRGMNTQATGILNEWKSEFPEEKMIEEAKVYYYQERDIQKTILQLKNVLRINPTYSDAYSFLGTCYLDLMKTDSALLLIRYADALSPNRPNNIGNMAKAYLLLGDNEKAEKYYLKSCMLDTLSFIYPYNTAKFYERIGNRDQYMKYMNSAAEKDDVPVQVHRELLVQYLQSNRISQGIQFYQQSDLLQSDSLFIKEVHNRYPQIKIPSSD